MPKKTNRRLKNARQRPKNTINQYLEAIKSLSPHTGKKQSRQMQTIADMVKNLSADDLEKTISSPGHVRFLNNIFHGQIKIEDNIEVTPLLLTLLEYCIKPNDFLLTACEALLQKEKESKITEIDQVLHIQYIQGKNISARHRSDAKLIPVKGSSLTIVMSLLHLCITLQKAPSSLKTDQESSLGSFKQRLFVVANWLINHGASLWYEFEESDYLFDEILSFMEDWPESDKNALTESCGNTFLAIPLAYEVFITSERFEETRTIWPEFYKKLSDTSTISSSKDEQIKTIMYSVYSDNPELFKKSIKVYGGEDLKTELSIHIKYFFQPYPKVKLLSELISNKEYSFIFEQAYNETILGDAVKHYHTLLFNNDEASKSLLAKIEKKFGKQKLSDEQIKNLAQVLLWNLYNQYKKATDADHKSELKENIKELFHAHKIFDVLKFYNPFFKVSQPTPIIQYLIEDNEIELIEHLLESGFNVNSYLVIEPDSYPEFTDFGDIIEFNDNVISLPVIVPVYVFLLTRCLSKDRLDCARLILTHPSLNLNKPEQGELPQLVKSMYQYVGINHNETRFISPLSMILSIQSLKIRRAYLKMVMETGRLDLNQLVHPKWLSIPTTLVNALIVYKDTIALKLVLDAGPELYATNEVYKQFTPTPFEMAALFIKPPFNIMNIFFDKKIDLNQPSSITITSEGEQSHLSLLNTILCYGTSRVICQTLDYLSIEFLETAHMTPFILRNEDPMAIYGFFEYFQRTLGYMPKCQSNLWDNKELTFLAAMLYRSSMEDVVIIINEMDYFQHKELLDDAEETAKRIGDKDKVISLIQRKRELYQAEKTSVCTKPKFENSDTHPVKTTVLTGSIFTKKQKNKEKTESDKTIDISPPTEKDTLKTLSWFKGLVTAENTNILPVKQKNCHNCWYVSNQTVSDSYHYPISKKIADLNPNNSKALTYSKTTGQAVRVIFTGMHGEEVKLDNIRCDFKLRPLGAGGKIRIGCIEIPCDGIDGQHRLIIPAFEFATHGLAGNKQTIQIRASDLNPRTAVTRADEMRLTELADPDIPTATLRIL